MSYLRAHEEHALDAPTTFSYITINSYLGTIEVQHCQDCSYVLVRCTHERCTWTDGDDEVLTCNLCGVDAT